MSLVGSGCVGFEPYRPEVVSCGQAHVGVQGGGQAPQQADSGLGTAFFDALDLIDGHLSAPGQFGGTQIQGAALVVNGLAEGQCLADGDRSGSSACSGGRTQRVW
jgi:hypothetical protein